LAFELLNKFATEEKPMARIHLNARKVESLQAGTKRIQIFDKSQPNLALRIAPSGVKSWPVVYKWNGRMKRFTLGTYPAVSLAEARGRAFDALRNVARGDAPQAKKVTVREAGTFADLAEQYMQEWSKTNKRTWREDQREFNVYLFPKWKHLKASAIIIDDVELLLDQLPLRGSVQANRVRALVRHVYAWALAKRTRRKKYALENNPCAFVPKLARERARVYSDDELKALWKSFDTIGTTGDIFKLQLLTSARPGEVSEMSWGELGITRAIWTQPSTRTKNRKTHIVPLCSSAVRILETLQHQQAELKNVAKRNSPFVFHNPRNPELALTWLQKAGERVRERLKVADFRPHDLRRTCATRLAEMGVPIQS
jgi:integrase